jgi:hypothetical protein|tara:strand:- start:78 stop:212 length:135 start_codon:yes stop_codon:yes gene_type:complete
MAKKKASIGVITFVRDKPRKRPLRHAKKYSKRKPHRKRYRGQGR